MFTEHVLGGLRLRLGVNGCTGARVHGCTAQGQPRAQLRRAVTGDHHVAGVRTAMVHSHQGERHETLLEQQNPGRRRRRARWKTPAHHAPDNRREKPVAPRAVSPVACSSPSRTGIPAGAVTALPGPGGKREEPAGSATGFPPLAGREFPGSGSERGTRGRPGGKMAGTQVRGTIARNPDDGEQA